MPATLQSALAGIPALLALLLASGVLGTTFVHAGGTVDPAAKVGIAGGVEVLSITNAAAAWIGANATVNQIFKSTDQSVNVQATGTVQTVNLAGQQSPADFSLVEGPAAAVGRVLRRDYVRQQRQGLCGRRRAGFVRRQHLCSFTDERLSTLGREWGQSNHCHM